MVDNDAEKCRGCTIKHLSEVLVALQDTDTNEIVRNAYICGNLAHAANHFVHYSPVIADKIRTLRLDGINNDLSLAISITEFGQRLSAIIEEIANYKEEMPEAYNLAMQTRRTSGGCRCQQRK